MSELLALEKLRRAVPSTRALAVLVGGDVLSMGRDLSEVKT